MAFLERNANRGSISTGYDVDNSLKVQANSGNEWFYRDNPTAGNKKTFTFSFWLKRTQLTGYEADCYLMSQGSNARFHFAGDTLRFMFDGNSTELEAAGKLRDPAAWYHIVLAVDTTQSTNTNRVKAYVNGQVYSFNNSDWPSQNQESSWMSGTDMYFNTRDGDGSYDNSGYWSEVVVVDGQQLDPTSFGEVDANSGIWIPKDVSDLTFGSEGFYLKFDDSSALGADSSGNSNNVTLNNISAVDQATDTPTNNFATWQCNIKPRTDSKSTAFKDGGTTAVSDGNGTGWRGSISTMTMASGKWYMEYKLLASNSAIQLGGIPDHRVNTDMRLGYYLGQDGGGSFGWYPVSGYLFYWTGQHGQYTTTASANDIISLAIDKDNDKLFYAINGTWMQGTNGVRMDPTTPSTGHEVQPPPYHFAFWINNQNETHLTNMGGYTAMSISSGASDANGYGTFEYAPPTGYYSLCSKNLAEYG